MASFKRVFVTAVHFFMRLCDYVFNIFGIRLVPMNLEGMFRGLSQEELEETRDPQISGVLGLFVSCLEAASPNELDIVGRMIVKGTLHDIIRKRVGIKKTLAENPDILDVPIRRPIIIAAPFRSGSTLLHQLIAEDPQFMAPMLWEQNVPYPPGRPQNWRESPRYKKAVELLDPFLKLMDPRMNKVHEFRADYPAECTLPMERSMNLHRFVFTLPSMKPFADWVYSRGRQYYRDMFTFQRQTLQMIGYKDLETHHLVLKSFLYLHDLDVVQEVFPGACVVIIRRNLKTALASTILLFNMLSNTLGGRVADNIPKEILKIKAFLENGMISYLKKFDGVPQADRPYFDLEYTELVKDPISTVRAIYQHFKFPFTSDAETRMRAYLAANPQYKHGRIHYSLEEYGLTEKDIREAMGPYIEYFKDKDPNIL